jgi:uncharacterized membrane protein
MKMSQRIELSLFFMLFPLGIVLLYSYYYLATKNKKIINDLWGNIRHIKHLIPVYIGSMFVAAVGFLSALYYLYKTTSLTSYEKTKIPIVLMVIIIVSIFWMPLSLNYLKNKTKPAYLKYTIIAVLSIVAFASLYSTVLINNIKEKKYKLEQKIATIGMSFFSIHTFFFDNLSWNYNFF